MNNDEVDDDGKTGIEKLQEIKQKVATNMKMVGIENVDEKYCIVTVDAMSARKGRVENQPQYWASSGLDELKSVILTKNAP